MKMREYISTKKRGHKQNSAPGLGCYYLLEIKPAAFTELVQQIENVSQAELGIVSESQTLTHENACIFRTESIYYLVLHKIMTEFFNSV